MTKDIVEILDDWFDSRLTEIHTIIPGKIVEYYGHRERKAKVKPLVKLRTVNDSIVEIGEIENVPIVFTGSSDCNILYPLKKDDGVLLLFSDCHVGY